MEGIRANRARLAVGLLAAPAVAYLFAGGVYDNSRVEPAKTDRDCVKEFYPTGASTLKIPRDSECDRPSVVELTLPSESLDVTFVGPRNKKPSRVSSNGLSRKQALEKAEERIKDVEGGRNLYQLRWLGLVALIEGAAFGLKRYIQDRNKPFITPRTYPDSH